MAAVSVESESMESESMRWSEHPMVAAARDLGPLIRAEANQIEANGFLPAELTEAMTRAQIFQMYLPSELGGPEVHPLTAFAVGEELTRHDASVGWCAQVAAAVTIFLSWLDPDELARMVEITDGPMHVAGSARPLGTAEEVAGGYLVSGHWNFASGVRHANWFLASSFVDRDDGSKVARSMFVPVADGEIVDNWSVMGMRGTGSDDFVLDGVFVPRSRVGATRFVAQRTSRLYQPSLGMVATWAPTAGVGVGLARGAIDALTELGDQASTGSPEPLKTRSSVQQAIGEAETIASSARAFLVESMEAAWDAVPVGGPALDRAVARAQLAITNTLNEAVRVADLCFHAAGTNAISSANRLERTLRDAHTAVQHAAGQPIHRTVAGRVLLGLDPGPPLLRPGPSTPRA